MEKIARYMYTCRGLGGCMGWSEGRRGGMVTGNYNHASCPQGRTSENFTNSWFRLMMKSFSPTLKIYLMMKCLKVILT